MFGSFATRAFTVLFASTLGVFTVPAQAGEPPAWDARLAVLSLASIELAGMQAAATLPRPAPVVRPGDDGPRPAALAPMYASLVALQLLDVHSTTRALRGGGARETNPAMRGVAENPAGLTAVKMAGAAATIYGMERLRRNSPKAAIITMVVVNSVMATIVAHNYRVGGR